MAGKPPVLDRLSVDLLVVSAPGRSWQPLTWICYRPHSASPLGTAFPVSLPRSVMLRASFASPYASSKPLQRPLFFLILLRNSLALFCNPFFSCLGVRRL